MNMQQMMKQAQKMQKQLAQAQEKLGQTEVSASAGGGMVKVTGTADGRITSITIDPEVVDPDDVEMLQDMVVAAANEALRKADAEQAASMSKLTGGLNLGGLF